MSPPAALETSNNFDRMQIINSSPVKANVDVRTGEIEYPKPSIIPHGLIGDHLVADYP